MTSFVEMLRTDSKLACPAHLSVRSQLRGAAVGVVGELFGE